MKIIYKNSEGGVSVITPSDEALASHTIEAIANKDVPEGTPYQIVESVPEDRTFRNAWEVDEAALVSGTGAASNEF